MFLILDSSFLYYLYIFSIFSRRREFLNLKPFFTGFRGILRDLTAALKSKWPYFFVYAVSNIFFSILNSPLYCISCIY